MPTRRSQALIIAGLLALAGSLGYANLARPNLVPKNFGIVEPGVLYRSGALTPAATRRVADEHHIRTIIDLGGYDGDPIGERLAARTAAALKLERHVFRLEGDGTGNPNAYVEALRIINDPARQPVLIHCSAGAQRTGACILLYREHIQQHPFAADLPEAERFGHDPAKNTRLRPYLDQWHVKIGDALRAGGLIDGQPRAEIEDRSAQ